MKELKYRLIKEDYKNWIRWNVARHDSKKLKIASAIFFVIFAFLFLGRSFALAGNFKANIGPVLVLTMVGAAMYYTISPQNQERVIWKRSGLGRLEKAGRFPDVKLTILEKGITIEVAAEGVRSFTPLWKSALRMQRRIRRSTKAAGRKRRTPVRRTAPLRSDSKWPL